MNSLFLDTLCGKQSAKIPVWFMRQAGRYLPEYQKLRAQAGSFLNLCQNPEWASEVTVQPIRRFDLDAAIIFADILLIADHLTGGSLSFVEKKGPVFQNPINTEKAVDGLNTKSCVENLDYLPQAIIKTKQKLQNQLPLIGFCGSPFTVASYLFTGGKSQNQFLDFRKALYENPKLITKLLTIITQSSKDYLSMQIEAGVDAIQIFDSWGGIVPEELFLQFSLPFMWELANHVKTQKNIPVILFARRQHGFDKMAHKNIEALGVDEFISLKQAFAKTKPNLCLQGNLDPFALASDDVASEVRQVLAQKPADRSLVFNLGHGVMPWVNPEALTQIIHTIKKDV